MSVDERLVDKHEVERIATVRVRPASERSGASEVRISLCDAGQGPYLNVRRWVTAPPNGSPFYYVGKGKKRTRKERSRYVGPTRDGLTMQAGEDALEMAELLVKGVLAAEPIMAEYEREGAA